MFNVDRKPFHERPFVPSRVFEDEPHALLVARRHPPALADPRPGDGRSSPCLPGAGARRGRLLEFLPKASRRRSSREPTASARPKASLRSLPAYAGDRLLGHVYLNSDFANAVGYSGKPIQMLVGIDPLGVIRGIKLVDHKEPIVLVGIPEKRVVDSMNALIGKAMTPIASGAERPPQVDIVSGATVTVLVMSDSVVRSAVRLIRSGRLGQPGREHRPPLRPLSEEWTSTNRDAQLGGARRGRLGAPAAPHDRGGERGVRQVGQSGRSRQSRNRATRRHLHRSVHRAGERSYDRAQPPR